MANFPHNLEIENGPANFADNLKTPKNIWKIVKSFDKNEMVRKSLQKVYKTLKYLECFPGYLREMKIVFTAFQIIWKVFKHSDSLKSFGALWKLSI